MPLRVTVHGATVNDFICYNDVTHLSLVNRESHGAAEPKFTGGDLEDGESALIVNLQHAGVIHVEVV